MRYRQVIRGGSELTANEPRPDEDVPLTSPLGEVDSGEFLTTGIDHCERLLEAPELLSAVKGRALELSWEVVV